MTARDEMHPLALYLEAAGETAESFAMRVGASPADIAGLLAGGRGAMALSRRIVAACGGAVELADLVGAGVMDARGGVGATDEIDVEVLEQALVPHLAGLLGGARRAGDRAIARLGAEAAANTYLALGVTGRTREGRLVLALRPVLQEILEDYGAPPQPPEALAHAAQTAASTYFQARRKTRP